MHFFAFSFSHKWVFPFTSVTVSYFSAFVFILLQASSSDLSKHSGRNYVGYSWKPFETLIWQWSWTTSLQYPLGHWEFVDSACSIYIESVELTESMKLSHRKSWMFQIWLIRIRRMRKRKRKRWFASRRSLLGLWQRFPWRMCHHCRRFLWYQSLDSHFHRLEFHERDFVGHDRLSIRLSIKSYMIHARG